MSNRSIEYVEPRYKVLTKYLEYLVYPYIAAFPVLAAILGEFSGYTFSEWMYFYLMYPIIGLAVMIIFRIYWKNNYKFRMLFHMLNLALLLGILTRSAGRLGFYSYNNTDPVLSQYLSDFGSNLIYHTLVIAPIGISIIINLVSEPEYHINNFNRGFAKLADGDFASAPVTDIKTVEDSTFTAIANNYNLMVKKLSSFVENVAGVNSINQEADGLSSIAEEINATTEEISSTSFSMSESATQQAEMLVNIMASLDMTNEIIDQVNDQISGNSELISQIALQTNILALNAGIEASRAGDYGRGFAVVAENVRRLSEESKLASEKIKEVVSSISDTLSTEYDKIKHQIHQVSVRSEDTAASAEELSASIEELTATAEGLSATANSLYGMTEKTSDILNKVAQSKVD